MRIMKHDFLTLEILLDNKIYQNMSITCALHVHYMCITYVYNTLFLRPKGGLQKQLY